MSSYDYRDVGGTLHKFEQKPGSGAGEEVPVHDLPADLRAALLALTDISTKLTALSGYVDGLETLVGATNTALTTLQGYVDGLEGLVGTTNTTLTTLNGNVDQLEGYTDTLETLIGTTNTALTALQGYVDQLEGYNDGVETLLTNILTALTPGTPVVEQKTGIATGADTQFTTATLRQGASIQNESTGGQLIYLTVVTGPTSTTSRVLAPGQSSGWIPAASTAVFFLRSSASGGAASIAGG